MGIACIPAIPVTFKTHTLISTVIFEGKFDFTGILWGYPTSVVGKSCNNYGGNHVIMKYEIKLYREMHVSFTSKTHVDVMFVGI